jgi:serine/threonine protein kinase
MDDYAIGNVVDQGGHCDLREVECVSDGWRGVVKELRDHTNPDLLGRFQREVRLMLQLDHPNVVKVRAANLTSTPPWFAMERAEASLRKRLASGTHGDSLIEGFLEVCDGVAHAHSNGILHRDLKPENILIFDDGFSESFVVADFGLGKHYDQATLSLTATNVWMGSIPYMAPEQFSDFKHVDIRTDVFALGKVLYEVLTGEQPLHVDIDKADAKFRHVITRAIDNSPDRRYQSVEEFRVAVAMAAGASANQFSSRTDQLSDLVAAEQLVPTDAGLKAIADVLVSGVQDETFLITGMPKLPQPILERLLSTYPHETKAAVESYDSLIAGRVSFSYCDTAADFYESLFTAANDPDMRKMVLLRLPVLAADHNRWHVGEVFGRTIRAEAHEGNLLEVRDLLISRPDVAAFVKPYLKNVAQLIADAT